MIPISHFTGGPGSKIKASKRTDRTISIKGRELVRQYYDARDGREEIFTQFHFRELEPAAGIFSFEYTLGRYKHE